MIISKIAGSCEMSVPGNRKDVRFCQITYGVSVPVCVVHIYTGKGSSKSRGLITCLKIFPSASSFRVKLPLQSMSKS